MKQIVAVIVILFLSGNAFSATEPKAAIIAPLASKSLLLDIAKISSTKLVAVGEYGHILTSIDGDNWLQAKVPVQSTLTRVFFINEKLGWAVGHDATILHSKDGGDSWQIQQYKPELERPLFDVIFKDANLGIAMGAYGQFFRTNNGGETWIAEFHSELLVQDDVDYLNELKAEDEEAYLDEISSILPHFNRITRFGRTLYLTGEIGLLAKSNDFGTSWQKIDEIYNGSFFDITRTPQGNLLVVGLRGNIFRSLDDATPWQAIKTDTTALLSAIVKSDDQRVFVLGNNGVLLESNDDGRSFTLHTQPDGKALISGVWFNNKLVATSEVGIKSLALTQYNTDPINTAGAMK